MHLAKIRKKGRNVLKRVGSKIDGRLNCYMHYFKIESTFLGHLRGNSWGPVQWWALSVLRSSRPSRKAGISLNQVGSNSNQLNETKCSFYTPLFCCIEMRWLFICSTAIWVNGSNTVLVASRAKAKLTSSKCDWTRIWDI